MIRPSKQIESCGAEVQLYIQSLECDAKMGVHHRSDVMLWEQTMMRLVGEDGPADVEKAINKLKSQVQRATLDQFAMAALPVAYKTVLAMSQNEILILSTRQHKSMLTQKDVDEALAVTTYNYAEAMLAESRKRQGGAE